MQKPTLINNSENLGKIKDIACGAKHSLILNEDGIVYAFGNNEYGQCGVPIGSDPVSLPTPINNPENLRKIKNIACGDYLYLKYIFYNLLLDEDGSVYSFGSNGNNYRLGRNIIDDDYYIPGIIEIDNVKKIACGSDYSMMIDVYGKVYGIGSYATGVNRSINLIGKNLPTNNITDKTNRCLKFICFK